MDRGGIRIDTGIATTLVRQHIDPSLTVTSVRKLHGGMVHRVCEFVTDGEPATVVAKLNGVDQAAAFSREHDVLAWYREHTDLPVPRPYGFIGCESNGDFSGLLLEKIPGATLSDARLSDRGAQRIQHELAHHVAALHTHTRDSFGPALDSSTHERWLDAFRPTLKREFEAVRDLISSKNRWAVQEMISDLQAWLPEQATPTLVHGDLWSANILVDDSHPDRPRILAFIDCGASYCDPEYELAYLRIFRTGRDEFFEAYSRHHALRPGFDRRCRVYWLNTLLLHVRTRGDHYLPACEDLANQICQMS